MYGHVNINFDDGSVRYEYPKNVPCIVRGVLDGKQIAQWAKEQKERVDFVVMLGEKMDMVMVGQEQVEVVGTRLREMADDMAAIALQMGKKS